MRLIYRLRAEGAAEIIAGLEPGVEFLVVIPAWSCTGRDLLKSIYPKPEQCPKESKKPDGPFNVW